VIAGDANARGLGYVAASRGHRLNRQDGFMIERMDHGPFGRFVASVSV
jgi:hypothetical protein